MRLRVAVVGAGLMGGWHARYAARFAEVAAIVDRRGEAAARLQGRFPRAAVFDDLGECLKSGGVDVVHVCTGLESHAGLIEAALNAGKHVLCEKPLVRSAHELEPLLDLARQRDLRLMAVHQLPFQRGFRRAQRDLSRLGDLVRIEYVVCSAGGEGRSPEERSEILLEMLPHPLSLLRNLLGRVLDADALEVLTHDGDGLRLAGCAGRVQLDAFLSLTGRPPRHELVVTGTRGSARLDLFHGFSAFEEGSASRRSKILRPFRQALGTLGSASGNLVIRALGREPAYPGLLELIRAFYRAVDEGTPLPVGAEEMRQSVALMDRGRRERAAGLPGS
jgi:predicted dehydrogenase